MDEGQIRHDSTTLVATPLLHPPPPTPINNTSTRFAECGYEFIFSLPEKNQARLPRTSTSYGSLGLGSVKSELMDNSTFEIVNAGDH